MYHHHHHPSLSLSLSFSLCEHKKLKKKYQQRINKTKNKEGKHCVVEKKVITFYS